VLQSFKELKVWQRSFELCANVNALTRTFPAEERFGLTIQLRRAAVSIPSDIAEGHSRDTTRDYLRFLWMAKGSLAEVETQLLLATRLGLGTAARLDALIGDIDEIGRMLRALIRSLDGDSHHQPPATATPANPANPPNPQSSIPNPPPAPLDPSPDPERRA
jgi:four helix bundle protein